MEYSSDTNAQVAYVTNASGSESITQSQETNNAHSGSVWGTGPGGFSQSFIVDNTNPITKFTLNLYKSTGATGTLTAYIYNDNGSGKPGTSLATFSNMAVNDLTTNKADYNFLGTYTPVISTVYYIVLIWTGGTNGDRLDMGINTAGGYSGGYSVLEEDGIWYSFTSYDTDFDIYQTFPPVFQSYSESTIKTQGSYSLKGIAAITDSLNKTLTRTIGSTINLSGISQIKFDIYSSRTGSNIKLGIHDSGGVTTEITPNILSANTWQEVKINLQNVINTNKDVIDSIIITVVNADAANTFYLDNMFGYYIPNIMMVN